MLGSTSTSKSARNGVSPGPRGTSLRPSSERNGTGAEETPTEIARPERAPAHAFPIPVIILIISLAIPTIFEIGPLTVHTYRLVLIIVFIPVSLAWLRGRGGLLVSDALFLLFSVWAGLSLSVIHGPGFALEPSGIFLVETFGAYLLGRIYVRNLAQFRTIVGLVSVMVLLLLPVAIVETQTDRSFVLELLRPIIRVHNDVQTDPRLGLYRAQTVFPHPILFGIFCATAFGLATFALPGRAAAAGRVIRSGLMMAGVVFSLSTGALVVVATQFALVVWGWVTRSAAGRWLLLFGLIAFAYIAVDLAANRSPIEVFIAYLSFNHSTSYNRILIWTYGSAEVLNNPIFGIGFNDWKRPYWMVASVDNFWLLTAMRYGLVGFALFAAGFIAIVWQIGRARIADADVAAARFGLIVVLTSLAVGAVTVHYWNELYILFMLLIGAGSWMIPSRGGSPAQGASPQGEPSSSPSRGQRSRRTTLHGR